MRLTEVLVATLFGCAVLGTARADSSAELKDLAARVDYGFYNNDAHALDVARAALDRLGDSAAVQYYRDYAALRRAQLGPAGRAAALVRDCAERELPADRTGPAAAEAWVLVAACAVVGQQSSRRVEQALSRARELDKRNPRIGLIEAWVMRHDGGDATALAAKLEQAIAAFDAWNAPPNAPDWGEAEALAALADVTLARGEARAARDLIERALLLVPDYSVAVELRARLQSR
jgi:tetratricopeptide (TPR) repeat protein